MPQILFHGKIILARHKTMDEYMDLDPQKRKWV